MMRRYVLGHLRPEHFHDIESFGMFHAFMTNRPIPALPFEATAFSREDLDHAIEEIKTAAWYRSLDMWGNQVQQAAQRKDEKVMTRLLRELPVRDIRNQHVTAEVATQSLTDALLSDEQNMIRPTSAALMPLNLVFYPNSVYLFGAKPGVGKSALAEQLLLDLTDQGAFCLDISVELNETTRTQRYHQHIGGVDFSPRAYNEFSFDPDRLEYVIDTFVNVPDPSEPSLRKIPRRLTIDARSVSIEQIIASIKLWLHDVREQQSQLRAAGVRDSFGPPIVLIDFLQIVGVSGSAEIYVKMNVIAEQLYELAKEEEISMVWISQLRKDDKQRDPNAPPSVEDLEGTSRMQQLAHHVLLIHRPMSAWTSGDWVKVMVNAPKVRTGEIYTIEGAYNGKELTFNFDDGFLSRLVKTSATRVGKK